MNRANYGLKTDNFVFYSLFDGNSRLTRKNPLAGIYAFQRAFKNKKANVQYVVKAINISLLNKEWKKIVDLSREDSRIILITKQMERQELIDFMASCDVFTSLHRSEGFGRVLAEAMLLGQPVIASNFSGNTDFCLPDTALLVDGELTPLKPNDYLLTEGQYWCEPSIEIAALHMIELYEDRIMGKVLGKNAKSFIETNYSLGAVAKEYQKRLDLITAKISNVNI